MIKHCHGSVECKADKAYIAVAPAVTPVGKLNAYVLITTADGWRFVRERGQAFGCPQPSAEEAISMVRTMGAMVFESDSLFDALGDKIKKIV